MSDPQRLHWGYYMQCQHQGCGHRLLHVLDSLWRDAAVELGMQCPQCHHQHMLIVFKVNKPLCEIDTNLFRAWKNFEDNGPQKLLSYSELWSAFEKMNESGQLSQHTP